MLSKEPDAPRSQDDFILGCFTRVCRVYWGVTLLPGIAWTNKSVCQVSITGLHPDLERDFEQRLVREFDATGYTVLGGTRRPEANPPDTLFEIHSRLSAAPELAS